MTKKRMGLLAGLVTLAAPLGACGSSSSTAATRSSSSAPGSTLVAPLISQWQPEYDKEAGVAVAYSAIGSGGGIAQITARTVDFGASDAPLTEDQFKEATKEGSGVVQIPWALGSVVAVYHVEGVPNHLRAHGPGSRRNLRGQDHGVERPEDRGAEPRRHPAVDEDHPGLPQRRQRRHLRLHRLPLEGQPRMEVLGRQRHAGEVPGRRGRQGQLGHLGHRQLDERVDRLPDARIRAAGAPR